MAKKKNAFPINPTILEWARKEAGFSLPEAASYAKIKPIKQTKSSHELSSEEHLAALEKGERQITKTMLESLAALYQRPVITFFLPAPPPRKDFFVDYRTIIHGRSQDSPSFQALKRRIYNLHQELLSIAKDNEQQPYAFIGSCKDISSVEVLHDNIVEYFGVNPRNAIRRRLKPDELFKKLREQAQDAGVYVILQGNLGSYHTAIPIEEFRGMAISDSLTPMIIINANDTPSAKSFTLMHELCHILLGNNALGNFNADHNRHCRTEILCNAVAAEYLVPHRELLSIVKMRSTPEDYFEYGKFFGVSSLVIARRLYDLGKITKNDYLQQQALATSKINKNNITKYDSNGPNPNMLLKSYLGKKLLNTLDTAVNNGQLTTSDLTSILHISFSRFEKVVS